MNKNKIEVIKQKCAEAVGVAEDITIPNTLKECIETQCFLKEVLESVKELSKNLGKTYDHLRLGKIPELMDEGGVTNITIEDIGRCTLEADVYASIPASSRVDAYNYLEDTGHGDIVVATVNAGTLKSLAKKLLKDGNPLPEDLFKVTPFTRSKITRL